MAKHLLPQTALPDAALPQRSAAADRARRSSRLRSTTVVEVPASSNTRAGEVSQTVLEHMALADKTDHTRKREENVEGSFWVDETCIDCDTCRWMAPKVFKRQGIQSAVYAQPATHEDTVRAAQALVSCPSFSIHSGEKSDLMKEARAGLPELIESAPGAFYCGYNSKASYGGNGYLLVREGGNVLVDSPRYTPQLAQSIREKGGAKFMFLTHKDDVADHAKWAEVLGCTRIIHKAEATENQGTTACEVQLEGEGPWKLPDGGNDVELIWTPGHSDYHVVLYYAPSKVLFSGDHLSSQHDDPGQFAISRDFNWYDFELQKKSVEKLLAWDWTTVLPGHGRRLFVKDAAHREQALKRMYEVYA